MLMLIEPADTAPSDPCLAASAPLPARRSGRQNTRQPNGFSDLFICGRVFRWHGLVRGLLLAGGGKSRASRDKIIRSQVHSVDGGMRTSTWKVSSTSFRGALYLAYPFAPTGRSTRRAIMPAGYRGDPIAVLTPPTA